MGLRSFLAVQAGDDIHVIDGEGEIGGGCEMETLSDIDAEVTALEGKLSKARRVKQGMIQELLTGKIRLV